MELSRLKVGVDVPWVTSWTAETVLAPGDCMTAPGFPAVRQENRPGFGKPRYSENHFVRQRASVQRMLCPMCGRSTEPKDRFTLTAKRKVAGAMRGQGLGEMLPADLPDERIVIDAGAIAPLHRACADRSSVQCPHLSADPGLDLMRFPLRWYVSPLFVAADDPALPPVIAFLQLCGITDASDQRWRARVTT